MAFDKKSFRLLTLFDRLSRNEIIKRQKAADEFDVSVKSIERDISDLNIYTENALYSDAKIVFDKKAKGYRLNNPLEAKLSKEETLSILKVILESRAFSTENMNTIFHKLLNGLSQDDKKLMYNFYSNEKFHYMQTKNAKPLFKILWDFSLAVNERHIIQASYKKITEETPKNIEVEPVSILFSEYYFYLLAYYHGKDYPNPTVFRLDNFLGYSVTDTKFTRNHSYKDRFEEGEFRKRVQFMNIGELITIEFEFWGRSLDAVTDRLPTAKVIGKNGDRSVLRAEIYGKGVKMWLLSQGEYLKVTKPLEFVEEMKQTISNMLENYNHQP